MESSTSFSVGSVPAIAIIGCGFGGLALARALTAANIQSFVILERGNDVGGVWRDNGYPGAACDIVSRLYSMSHDTRRVWTDDFASRDEIYRYLGDCANENNIRSKIRFNTAVTGASFDEHRSCWVISTDTGETIVAGVLVSAVGQFNNPNIPNFPGGDDFAGPQFHSAQWRHDVSLAGRTVAVIGNGASAVQFLPRVAKIAEKLYLFQRSPQYVMPKSIFPGTGTLVRALQRYPALRGLARLKIFIDYERRIWRRLKPHAHLKAEAVFRDYLASKVPDPALRRKLTPDYPSGCKRPLGSDEWYDALTRSNVEVVDTPIERMEPGGIRTRDGNLRSIDAIIYGTGFTPTKFLVPMQMTGLGGRTLNDAWRDGAEAYYGMSVTGFPNFFMMYGPNTNVSGSVVYMLECQARYIVKALRILEKRRATYMYVKPDAQGKFNSALQSRLDRTVWSRPDCFSYVKDANGRVTAMWPSYAFEYRWKTRVLREQDYTFAGR